MLNEIIWPRSGCPDDWCWRQASTDGWSSRPHSPPFFSMKTNKNDQKRLPLSLATQGRDAVEPLDDLPLKWFHGGYPENADKVTTVCAWLCVAWLSTCRTR